ncbi:MAG TPA: alcohol dehydrogenase catalytic domain-containing protein [Baekduia sp.]|nr:alcohol dehydrogenase catalytic domain-containing protein [Baekduia sp.]
MRVARSVGTREVVVAEEADPVAGPEEVVVRVLACGVCGSDVSDAWVAPKLPAVLGHEVCGVVEQAGAGVTAVAPGDRVVLHHHAGCGTCRRCTHGHETLCEAFRAGNLDPGGFAERVRVPAELVDELLPTALDPVLATFTEPLACVLRALDRGGLRAGDTLLVLGCGTGGLLAVAAAHARGVEVVWVREPRAERRARAVALGAAPHGGEPVDVALVCAPGDAAVQEAFGVLAPGGRLVLYATPTAPQLALDAASLYAREIELRPSYSAGRADMRAALALLESGAVDPAPLVTHRLELARTGEALDLARRGEALKAVVLP